VLFVSVGELAGFTLPGVLGVVTQGVPTSVQVATLVGGGVVEGATLGLAQALVLRRVMAGFRTSAWIGATAGAAAFAWLLGMLPSVTHAMWSTWPVGWVAVAGAGLGLLLLCSIGTAQALVMPTSVPRAYRWVGWTALGWCAGLTAFSALTSPLWHEGQTRLAVALVGMAGGLTMAVVMAAVTGIGVVRISGPRRSERGSSESRT
jgi:Ca2+-transporting ATPase